MTLLYGVAVLVLLSIAGSALIKAARTSRAKRQDDLAFSTSIDRGQRYVIRSENDTLPGGYENHGWTDSIVRADVLAHVQAVLFDDVTIEVFDRSTGRVVATRRWVHGHRLL